jgi:thiamine transport system permease protein
VRLLSRNDTRNADDVAVIFARVFGLLAIVPVAWFTIFFAWPTLHAFISLITLDALANTLGSTTTWSVLWFTTWQSLLSLVATLLFGIPITWVLSRFSFPGKRWARGIASMPFVLPTVVVAGAVMSLMPLKYQFGVHGIVIAHILFNVAVVIRVLGPRWESMHHDQIHAARILGASPLHAFFLVTLPQLRSALINACVVVFLFSFTSFGVVSVLGGIRRRTIEVEIYTNAIRLSFFDTAMVLALIQLIAIVIVLALSGLATRARQPSHGTATTSQALIDYPRNRLLIMTVAFGIPSLIASPFVFLFIRSFRSGNSWTLNAWRNLWNGSLERVGLDIPAILMRSVVFAFCAMLIATPMAYVLASLATYWRRSSHVIRAMTALPIVISAVTLGFGIIVTFNRSPFDWRGDTWLLPVIHAIVALPIAVYVLTPSLQAISPLQRDAARTLGASPMRVWWHIDARLMRTPATATAAISFAVSLGEFGATTFLSRSSSTTLPIAISQLLSRPGTTLQASGFALAAVLAFTTAVVMSRA